MNIPPENPRRMDPDHFLQVMVPLYKKWTQDPQAGPDLNADGLPHPTMEKFATWVQGSRESVSEAVSEARRELGDALSPDAMEYVQSVFDDPWQTMRHLLTCWQYLMQFVHEKPPRGITNIQLHAVVSFTDNRILHLQGVSNFGETAHEGAQACLVFDVMMSQILDLMAKEGLAQLYERKSVAAEELLGQRSSPEIGGGF